MTVTKRRVNATCLAAMAACVALAAGTGQRRAAADIKPANSPAADPGPLLPPARVADYVLRADSGPTIPLYLDAPQPGQPARWSGSAAQDGKEWWGAIILGWTPDGGACPVDVVHVGVWDGPAAATYLYRGEPGAWTAGTAEYRAAWEAGGPPDYYHFWRATLTAAPPPVR